MNRFNKTTKSGHFLNETFRNIKLYKLEFYLFQMKDDNQYDLKTLKVLLRKVILNLLTLSFLHLVVVLLNIRNKNKHPSVSHVVHSTSDHLV